MPVDVLHAIIPAFEPFKTIKHSDLLVCTITVQCDETLHMKA